MIYPAPYSGFTQTTTWQPWKTLKPGTPSPNKLLYNLHRHTKTLETSYRLRKSKGISGLKATKMRLNPTVSSIPDRLKFINKVKRLEGTLSTSPKFTTQKPSINLYKFDRERSGTVRPFNKYLRCQPKAFCLNFDEMQIIGKFPPRKSEFKCKSCSPGLKIQKYESKEEIVKIGTPGPWKSPPSPYELQDGIFFSL